MPRPGGGQVQFFFQVSKAITIRLLGAPKSIGVDHSLYRATPGVDSGGCFNKQGGLSDQMTDIRPMLFVHGRMVHCPVGRSVAQ